MVTERRLPPFPTRISDELHTRLDELAKANGRSLNAELLAILEAVIKDNNGLQVMTADLLIEEIARRMVTEPRVNEDTKPTPPG